MNDEGRAAMRQYAIDNGLVTLPKRKPISTACSPSDAATAPAAVPAPDTTLTLRPEDAEPFERGEICVVWFGKYRLCGEAELMATFAECDGVKE